MAMVTLLKTENANMKKNVPKIRFKGCLEGWESLEMASVFETKNGYTPSKFVDAYWENGSIPWFRMEDIRANGGILSNSLQHITPLGVKGSGLFQPYSIILATTATIGVHAMIIADSLANQQFTNFSIRKSLSNDFDPYYVYYAFFKIDKWCVANTNSGGLLSVDIKGLLKEPFYFPALAEQRQIASYFRSLDGILSGCEARLSSLRRLKEGALQAFFPQQGETQPRIRFKGCQGEWVRKKLGELGKTTSGIVFPEVEQGGKIGIPFFKVSDMNNIGNESLMISANNYVSEQQVSQNRWHVYTNVPAIFFAKVGAAVLLDRKRLIKTSCLFDNNTMAFGINQGLVQADFCLYLFETINLASLVQVGTLPSYNGSLVENLEVLIPTLPEQRLIANFFRTLDRRIELERQRLEKLRQLKAACLEKMFV